MTLVVNLFGGPGTGKSTTAALVFGLLKQRGYNVELVTEFAKDLTWEERHKTLLFQPYVTSKQIWRISRLLDQVGVIVTDSPILTGAVYQGQGYTQSFEEYICEAHREMWTLNLLLGRNDYLHPYNPKGRRQSAVEAVQVDHQIRDMLLRLGITYTNVALSVDTPMMIVRFIQDDLAMKSKED